MILLPLRIRMLRLKTDLGNRQVSKRGFRRGGLDLAKGFGIVNVFCAVPRGWW
jgi:hypothetical protein